ncbi:MAG: ATP-binding cassette domain-containing protein [Pseudomonadota bacterium]
MQERTTETVENKENSAESSLFDLEDRLPEEAAARSVDRTTPGSVLLLGAVFSLGTYLFLASLAIFTVFFHSNVINNGSWIVAPLLMMLAAVPVFGILVFEYAYIRALAGFRYLRGSAARRVQAIAGLLTLLVLTLVHPLSGLASLFSTTLGGLLLFGLARLGRYENDWDFLPAESTAVLAGRDMIGFALASKHVDEHALASVSLLSFTALALVAGYGTASYLTTIRVIDPNAVAAMSLLTALSSYSILSFVRDGLKRPALDRFQNSQVEAVRVNENNEEELGLWVTGLNVNERGGRSLLSDVNFAIPPGTILGIDGETGAGKSLLLRMIADPFSFENLQVRGRIVNNRMDLWQRTNSEGAIPAVLLTNDPILMPTTGENNLCCFQGGQIASQAKRNLEKLVFSSELVEEICSCEDARFLPGMQRKTLGLARAFTLSPGLYLMDRPEDALPEKQISAVLNRIQEEARLGRSTIIVTQNRAFLEACDKILVLQGGRVLDFGIAEEIRKRKATGWSRFASQRSLEIEDSLEKWIRSHFRRPGDEPNRRKVAHIASEMLALSCQNGPVLNVSHSIVFEFKHFVGHCVLRMQDGDAPISTTSIQKAETEVSKRAEGQRLSPLATILSIASDFEAGVDLDRRVLTVKVDTFDPRLSQTKEGHETTQI